MTMKRTLIKWIAAVAFISAIGFENAIERSTQHIPLIGGHMFAVVAFSLFSFCAGYLIAGMK
jgi:hypothetical protein